MAMPQLEGERTLLVVPTIATFGATYGGLAQFEMNGEGDSALNSSINNCYVRGGSQGVGTIVVEEWDDSASNTNDCYVWGSGQEVSTV